MSQALENAYKLGADMAAQEYYMSKTASPAAQGGYVFQSGQGRNRRNWNYSTVYGWGRLEVRC